MNEIPLSQTTKFIVDNRGRTAPTADSGIPLIATNCIDSKNLYPVYENLRYVSQETYETWFRSHPQPNDIILTLKGSQNGAVCLVPDPVDFVIAQDMVALRADESVIYPLFLFAALRSPDAQYQIKNLDVSGVIPHFKKTDFDKLLLPYPDKGLQKFIGDIYYNFSIKIDLLHRQNKTLEAMAETLFRQWFVEEAEESWGIGKLGDFIEIKHGYAFKGANIVAEETDKILITPGNFKIGGGFNFHKYKYFNSEEFPETYILNEGDFVVTMTDLSQDTDTLGYPAFVPEIKGKRLLHNQRVGKVLFRGNYSDKKFFFYHLMKSAEYRHFVLGSSSGMAVAHTSPSSIYGFEFNFPPDSLITKFEEQARIFYEKECSNQNQIQTLTKQRDELLPKLMSGDEVRVKITDAETAAADQ